MFGNFPIAKCKTVSSSYNFDQLIFFIPAETDLSKIDFEQNKMSHKNIQGLSKSLSQFINKLKEKTKYTDNLFFQSVT